MATASFEKELADSWIDRFTNEATTAQLQEQLISLDCQVPIDCEPGEPMKKARVLHHCRHAFEESCLQHWFVFQLGDYQNSSGESLLQTIACPKCRADVQSCSGKTTLQKELHRVRFAARRLAQWKSLWELELQNLMVEFDFDAGTLHNAIDKVHRTIFRYQDINEECGDMSHWMLENDKPLQSMQRTWNRTVAYMQIKGYQRVTPRLLYLFFCVPIQRDSVFSALDGAVDFVQRFASYCVVRYMELRRRNGAQGYHVPPNDASNNVLRLPTITELHQVVPDNDIDVADIDAASESGYTADDEDGIEGNETKGPKEVER